MSLKCSLLSQQVEANVSMKLRDLSKKQWVKQAEQKIPSARCLRVINQQLWCCCHDAGVVVLDSHLQQQRTIPSGDMGEVMDVAEMSNGDILIAATKGLHHSRNDMDKPGMPHCSCSWLLVCHTHKMQ